MNQLQNFPRYSLSAQPSQYSMIPDPQSQRLTRLPIPSHNPTFHSTNSPPFEYTFEPTKRIKYSPQGRSESLLKFGDLPYEALSANPSLFSQNQEALRLMYFDQHVHTNAGGGKISKNMDFQAGLVKLEDSKIPGLNVDLMIPPLNIYGIGKELSHYIDPEYRQHEKIQRQQFLQQKDRQDLETRFQQQLINQILNTRNQFDQVLNGMHEHDKLNGPYQCLPKLQDVRHLIYLRQLQALQAENFAKLNDFGECSSLITDSSNKNLQFEPVSREDNSEKYYETEIPDLKVEFNEIQDQRQRKGSFSFEKQKDKVKEKKTIPQNKPRKKRNQTDDYSQILGAAPLKKNSEGPRRRNKWQELTYDPSVEIAHEEKQPTEATNIIEENPNILPTEVKGTKSKKPQELPQHMQDDIDYNSLIRVTITNDPQYAGLDNSGSNFVVVNKEIQERNMNEQVEKTKVGSQYQAEIPKCEKENPRVRRRHPEMIWGPGTIRENELRRYFAELCQLLRCEVIHDERALKLLRRKKYKKDRVLINVTKNEKFYSTYLVAGDALNIPTENDVP